MLGDLRERVARDRVAPELPEARVVADVLLNQDPAVVVDGQVVQHLLPFGPVEQHVDRPPELRVDQVQRVEVESPEPAGAAEARGRDPVEVAWVARVPVAVLRPVEVGHARETSLGLDLRPRLQLRVLDLDELELRARRDPRGGLDGIADDLDPVQLPADEPGPLGRVPGTSLVADVDVDLTGRRVVQRGDDGLVERERVRDQVLPARVAEVAQLPARAVQVVGERTPFDSALLPAQKQPRGVALAGERVVEGALGRQIGGAQPRERDPFLGRRVRRSGPECDLLDQVLTLEHAQRSLVDRPLRDEGAVRAVCTDRASPGWDLVVREQRERAVAVVERSKSVRDPNEPVVADGIADGQDRLRRHSGRSGHDVGRR